jgi:hypothetical protein
MRCANWRITGLAWTCKYRSISSERHLPMRRMMPVSTLAQSRAMAPAAHMDRAEMSFGRKPKVGSRTVAPRRRVSVMSEGETYCHF